MSDSENFINEVTEELRRDQLFALFRRWAWLAVLIVVILVGGAAYLEWQRARTIAAAEAFGDSLVAALDAASPEARIDALNAVAAETPEAQMLIALLAAGESSFASDTEASAAAEALRTAAASPDLPRIYRDLALFKAHLLAPQSGDEARLTLGVLSEPGAPFAALAEEQLALLDIAEGATEAAINRLRGLENAAAATPGLQQRAAQLIVALEAGSVLVDAAPEPVVSDPDPAEEDGAASDAAADPATDGEAAERATPTDAADDAAPAGPEAEAEGTPEGTDDEE